MSDYLIHDTLSPSAHSINHICVIAAESSSFILRERNSWSLGRPLDKGFWSKIREIKEGGGHVPNIGLRVVHYNRANVINGSQAMVKCQKHLSVLVSTHNI